MLNRFWLRILLFWITFTTQASQAPQVVVSIKPIHSLVMNVMERYLTYCSLVENLLILTAYNLHK